jgi:excisionase family DNA binding protein
MILTTTQIAARLGVSERTAQRGITSGQIQAERRGQNRYEISEEELVGWLGG